LIAGLTDKEKAKIEQKYAKRQQAIAGRSGLQAKAGPAATPRRGYPWDGHLPRN